MMNMCKPKVPKRMTVFDNIQLAKLVFAELFIYPAKLGFAALFW